MSITNENFKINGDTLFWAIILLMLLTSYMTFKMGIYTEKISWCEEQMLKYHGGK